MAKTTYKPTEMTHAQTTRGKRRNYQATGVYSLRRAMKELTPKAIDGRTRVGRLRKALLRDMGGPGISAQRRVLADVITKATVLHGRVMESIETLPVVNRRTKKLFPATVEAIKLTDSLARLIALAGTEKAASDGGPFDLGSGL